MRNYIKELIDILVITGLALAISIPLMLISMADAEQDLSTQICEISNETDLIDNFIETNWETIPEAEIGSTEETYASTPVEVETNLIEEEMYDQFELLSYCVMAEAGNQEELGKRLVIDVILNRVNSDLFPNTIEEVIYQKNPVQFAVTANGSLFKHEPTEDIFPLIIEEYNNPVNTEILYFSANGYANGTPWQQVGDHYFSTQ